MDEEGLSGRLYLFRGSMGFLKRVQSAFSTRRLDVKSRFELLREAISGTMSKFYMVRDRATGETLGLKVLDRKKTATFEARFKGLHKPSEGEIALGLRHPSIVRTYEHGLTTEGSPYLVMEFLPGPGVHALLLVQDPRLDGRRLRFVHQAAEAVAAVHAAGYLHRDLSPRNLMLAEGGESIKLIDFGLSIPAQPAFFQPGNRTGNPNYMAPELVHRRETDHRVDVFAFGVTAYEILTSHLPWPEGRTGQAAMTHDKRPFAVQRWRPDIHPTLADAIHRCIEPNVKRRYPSIEEFLHAIHSVECEDLSAAG